MKVHAQGATDVGCVRKNNQDSIYMNTESLVFIVADGMGGHAGGEIASQMVVDHFKNMKITDLPSKQEDVDIQIFLDKNLNDASCEIYLRSIENPRLSEMGTTCSMVWIDQMKAHCAHAGDSRIYLLRNNFLYQLTDDHSLVAGQLKSGLLSESQAHDHLLKNVITRSIGYRKEEHVDTFSQELHSGDQLLLCSDGLYNKVSNQKISSIIASDIDGKADVLIQLARDGGGDDNISVVIVTVM